MGKLIGRTVEDIREEVANSNESFSPNDVLSIIDEITGLKLNELTSKELNIEEHIRRMSYEELVEFLNKGFRNWCDDSLCDSDSCDGCISAF